MQIEITDREYWLNKAEAGLVIIANHRKLEDEKYEKRWRKRWLLPDRKPNEFPEDDFPYYPSIDGWGTELTLEKIIRALKSEKTGTLYLTDEELRVLR